ncbi:saccharopine dehydrogenase family protein [Myxosarcina sp. GI1]|uniref:saccharopine dehydrogenase family protein n=1 Tax=Myxosarcina sp. GI1 TaxID=1541065 RepID=UPI000563255B|nr:saccharopine dehydrogenase family protein [Myxosarcina sp. GI1]
MVGRVLVIGAGAVGNVVVRKLAQLPEVFPEICLASRTKAKCDAIAARLNRKIVTAEVDADKTEQVVALINKFKPDILINVALPYQDLAMMDACLETGVDYVDTACYEAYDAKGFSYQEQWEYHERFKQKNIMALLGCGFDPGVTNVFVKYASEHHFDEIEYLDILDCNAGDHGLPFATNFNPEINIRELDQPGVYYRDGEWVEIPSLSIKRNFAFPQVGNKDIYLIYHEELETITKHIPKIQQARFWMTFSDSYIQHLNVLRNVGLTSIEPIEFQGQKIVPLQFLKALLPEPSTLGDKTQGKTNIGCIMQGKKDGKPKTLYVYQICDHQDCYREVESQGVAYTAGVPPVIGAALMLQNKWRIPGVFNCEQLDPMPFLNFMNEFGLPWTEKVGVEFDTKI